MNVRFLRNVIFLAFMTVVLVGWGASVGARTDSGAPAQSEVDELPFARFLGIGPGQFSLSNTSLSFLVKTGRNWEDVRNQPTFDAATNQYVWETNGSMDQYTFVLPRESPVNLSTVVEEGCRIRYLQLDDESDQRLNRFTINGVVVHTINPEQAPDPEGLTIYSEFVAPSSGVLGLLVEDSAALAWKLVCSNIDVVKSANPTVVNASGETVEFTVRVENVSRLTVTIDSLVDDQFGDLNGQGSCSVPQTLVSGAAYTCSFSAPVTFDAGTCTHVNVVTASGQDEDGEGVVDFDDAEVTRTPCAAISVSKTPNPAQVEAPGGDVQFSVVVANTGPASVTINTLTDDVFGDLNGQGSCSVPQTIPVGGSYECSFTGAVNLDGGRCVHVNTVTATGQGELGDPVQGSDDAQVTILPCAEISVTKTPNPAQLPIPGGEVEFTVLIANTGPSPVTIDSLVDDVFGDLNGQGSCSVPQELVVGGTYQCAFTGNVPLSELECEHVNTVTASGPGVSGQGTAEVICSDRTIQVTKTPNPAQLPIPGGDVVFTVVVRNTGPIGLTIDSLVDDVFGDLNGQGSCSVPQEIPFGESYECSFTGAVTLSEEDCIHINTVSASGPGVNGEGSAEVTCRDRIIQVTKTPNPASLSVPGGDVEFTVVVRNTGPAEIIIDSLTDDVFGDLNGIGSCSVPQTIAAGDSYSCSFTGRVEFPPEACTSHTNTVTASGSGVSGQGTAEVKCSNEPPKISVVKSADPAQLPVPGGDVTFSVTINNLSEAPVVIDTLVDSVYGDLNGQGTCSVPQTIPVDGSYSCSFTVKVELTNEQCTHTNTVTASGPGVSGNGSATVGCVQKDRKPACLRINFEVGPDWARRGTYVVRETGGHLLATWWAEEGWMDSGWIRDLDISAPAVYVQVIFVKGDGTEIVMKIVNPAPDTPYGWLARGQCHALEVAWP